jgi:hypothetical protein
MTPRTVRSPRDAAHGVVEGFLPIKQLPAAAENGQTLALTAIYVPREEFAM